VFDWLATLSPVLLLLLVALIVAVESLGVPLPGETILIATQLAILLHPDGVSPWAIALAAAVGAVGGDTSGYLIGRRYGRGLIDAGSRHFPRLLSVRKIDASIAALSRYGLLTVFIGRFVAVLRIFTAPLAGVSKIPYRRFILASSSGALIWAFGLTTLVELFGPEVRTLIHQGAWVALAAIAAGAIAVALTVGRVARRNQLRDVASKAAALVRRIPFTISFSVVFIAIGAATESLWSPAERAPWYPDVAYGLPSFADGRWWSIVSGTLVASVPLDYATFILFGAVAIAWLEVKRGSRKTILVFAVGQVSAILVAALVGAAADATSIAWAAQISNTLDAGPSGGYIAVLAAAIRTLPRPWLLRGKLAMGGILTILLLFTGDIAALEHFVAAMPILLYPDHRPSRPSRRDWRLIAFTASIALAVAPVVGVLDPTAAGPLGPTDPGNVVWTAALADAVFVALIANGLRIGYRVAWRLALLLAAANTLWGIALFVLTSDSIGVSPALQTSLASSVLWAVLLVILLVGRRGFLVPWRRRSRVLSDPAVDLTSALSRWGGGTLSWMLTWPPMRSALIAEHYFGHEQHGEVVVVLGDPLGDPVTQKDALEAFDRRATELGLVPTVFSASDAVRRIAPGTWRSLLIAEDSIIDLPKFTLTGKPSQPLRTALHRAEREGIRFDMVVLSEAAPEVVAQVREISEAWVGEKALPEMGFTLGGVQEALDPHVRSALAFDSDGRIHGVLSWLPVYGTAGDVVGWTLDLMRRRDGGFGPVIEYLIVSSALRFQEESADFLSLSGAPLAGLVDDDIADAGIVQNALASVGKLLEPLYGFQSLHAFKQKFHPRYEPMYLLYRDEADLPAIAVALVRAYLPDASAMDLARAGIQMVHR